MKDVEGQLLIRPCESLMHLNLISYCSEETLPHPHSPLDFPINANFTLQLRFMSNSLTLSLTSPSNHSENSIVFIYFLIGRVFIHYTLIIQNSEFYMAFAYTSKNISYFICLCLPNDSHFLSHPCFPSLQFLVTLPLLFACHF